MTDGLEPEGYLNQYRGSRGDIEGSGKRSDGLYLEKCGECNEMCVPARFVWCLLDVDYGIHLVRSIACGNCGWIDSSLGSFGSRFFR